MAKMYIHKEQRSSETKGGDEDKDPFTNVPKPEDIDNDEASSSEDSSVTLHKTQISEQNSVVVTKESRNAKVSKNDKGENMKKSEKKDKGEKRDKGERKDKGENGGKGERKDKKGKSGDRKGSEKPPGAIQRRSKSRQSLAQKKSTMCAIQ